MYRDGRNPPGPTGGTVAQTENLHIGFLKKENNCNNHEHHPV